MRRSFSEGVFEYDLFGYEKWVPKADEIESVSFGDVYDLSEPETIEAVLALGYPDEHKGPYTEEDADMSRVTWKKQPDITAASE